MSGRRAPHPRRLAVALAASLPALAACPASPYPEVAVDLAASGAVPTGARPTNAPVFRFSVAAMQSPQDTFAGYSRLFARLAPKLEVEIELVQRRTYQEVNDLLANGQIDAALVCTGGYVDVARRLPGSVELVAVPVVHGKTTYRSYVIVPESSPAQEVKDLRGKRFAYTDDLSLSGFGYLAQLLREMGADARSYFGSVTFTHSHDRSTEAVARGVVDGAAVDSLVYEELARASPQIRAGTRVIHRSPEYGVAPVVASTRLPPERRAALRAALLRLHEDPEARAALGIVGFDRFIAPDPALYASAAALLGDRP
jgi:phosphonate transport system substrate-binding protein